MTDEERNRIDRIQAEYMAAVCTVAGSMAMFNAVAAATIKDPKEAAKAASKMTGWGMVAPMILADVGVYEAMKAAGLSHD